MNIDCNLIGNSGAQALAQALASNSTLEVLSLCTTLIGDDGAEALAEALHSNISLKRLLLSENMIGDKGANALAESLCHNSSLNCLHLGGNPFIHKEGVHCLIRALTLNNSIENGCLILGSGCKEYVCCCPEYSNVRNKIHFNP